MPTVQLDTFQRLNEMANDPATSGDAPDEGSDDTEAPPVSVEQRQAAKLLWGGLGVGSLVLAQEDNPEHGWWEAIILARHKNTCTVCWRDHPGDGLAKRELHQLAFLHPSG